MARIPEIGRYSLYGERLAHIAPEFIHIEAISERSALHDWTISPHSHPGIYQFLLLHAGRGVLTIDSAEAELLPETLVAVPSGCVHAFRFDTDAEGWVLSIAGDLLHDPRISASCDVGAMAAGKLRWQRLTQGDSSAQRLLWLLADLDQSLSGTRSGVLPNALAAQLALVLALSDALLTAGDKADAPGTRRDTLIRRFCDLAESHFREGWTVERYAAALGTSAPTLARGCRELLLKSPGAFILDRVLLEAMRALTYTASSVSQIAEELGFVDPAYFARFFKLRTGMTASDFRQRRAWFRRLD